MLIDLMPNVVLSVLVYHSEQLCNCQWEFNYLIFFSLHIFTFLLLFLSFLRKQQHPQFCAGFCEQILSRYLQVIHCMVILFETVALIYFKTHNKFDKLANTLMEMKFSLENMTVSSIATHSLKFAKHMFCIRLNITVIIALKWYEPHTVKWPWLLCRNRYRLHMTRMS